MILFAKDVDADNFFQAVYRSEKARNYFYFIGTEGWMERVPLSESTSVFIPSLNGW